MARWVGDAVYATWWFGCLVHVTSNRQCLTQVSVTERLFSERGRCSDKDAPTSIASGLMNLPT